MFRNTDLIANTIGFLVLVIKTFFDMYINEAFTKADEKRFHADAQHRDRAAALALSAKIRRRDRSNILTFVGLAVSYLIAIVGGIHGHD